MQTVNSSETLLPRPHVILTYTTLFIHHCEKLKKKPSGWFMQKKLKYRNHIMFWTNIAWCNVTKLPPHLSYSFHCLIKWNNKEKGYNKHKSCKPIWNAKCTKKNSNKYHKYIYNWKWQILRATVFHSINDFQKFICEQTVLWILRWT